MEKSDQDKFKIQLSEAALFLIFSYFSRKEQLRLLRLNQWVYSVIAKFQQSKQFGVVHYYTREYTDVLKLHRARQDPTHRPWLRFLIDALYFAYSQLVRISFGDCNHAWLQSCNSDNLDKHFGSNIEDYVFSYTGEKEAWFRINLSVLFGGKTKWSKEFKTAVRRENVSLDRLLSRLRHHPKPGTYLEYPAFEVKLDPFRVRGMKKPIQVSFVFYADRYSWGDYKGQGIYVMERP